MAVALALCGLITLGLIGANTRVALDKAVLRAVQVAELRGTIAHLDELLTMSARMGALTGERRWAARYDEAEPLLDRAITEAVALARPEVAAELARTTDEANRRLVEMERSAFALSAAGEAVAAWNLLNSPEYEQLKAVYAQGINVFAHELESFAADSTASLHKRAWLETAGLILSGVVFLAAAAIATRAYARLRLAMVRTEAAARRDPLTGLPNRLRFREHMAQILSGAEGGAAVLFLDLDGFKGVNDLLGHAAGDELLRAVSARLSGCLREGDLVARLSGDEFVFVRSGTDRVPEIEALAKRLVTVVQEPFELCEQSVCISTSLGISLTKKQDTADGLLRDADIALYRAKAEGRGTWRFFTPEMEGQVLTRRTLEVDLRKALAEEQLELFYQPVVNAGTEGLVGFEALLRWRHPERGMISPAEFIPVAEEMGLIVDIGTWVLRRACAEAMAWPEHLNVAVNLSAVQFLRGDVVQAVEQALNGSGLRAGRLELEITETVLLLDNDTILAALHRLHARGTRVSMDDFGTGYSSLSYLRRFPFDKVKIDRSFIGSIGTRRSDTEIVRAVVGLSKALNIRVLAEGVETVEQLHLLQAQGCDELQGFLFGKPVPWKATCALIASSAAGRPQRPAA